MGERLGQVRVLRDRPGDETLNSQRRQSEGAGVGVGGFQEAQTDVRVAASLDPAGVKEFRMMSSEHRSGFVEASARHEWGTIAIASMVAPAE
jgi:hypothetical protein